MRKVKILLIDDSELVRKHLSELLSVNDLDVQVAGDLATALESLMKNPVDAILVDFVLGSGTTGMDLISAVFSMPEKLWEPLPRPVAAILTHGSLARHDQTKANDLGVAVLQKPQAGGERQFIEEISYWLKARLPKILL